MFFNLYYSNWGNIFVPHKCKLLIISVGYIWGSEVKNITSILQQKRGILIFLSFVIFKLNNEKRKYLKTGSRAGVLGEKALETH